MTKNTAVIARGLTYEIRSFRFDVKKKMILNIANIIFNINKFNQEIKEELVEGSNLSYTTEISERLGALNEDLTNYPPYNNSEIKNIINEVLETIPVFEASIFKIKQNERLERDQPNIKLSEGYKKELNIKLNKIKTFLEYLKENLKENLKETTPKNIKKWWNFGK